MFQNALSEKCENSPKSHKCVYDKDVVKFTNLLMITKISYQKHAINRTLYPSNKQ